MGTKPATRLDTWAQWAGIIATIITLGLLLLSSERGSEHRLTLIEAHSADQTKLAQDAATNSQQAYDIARLSARGTLILLEVVRLSPQAKAKRPEIEDVMAELKKRKISENRMPDFAGGGMGAMPSGVSQ